MSLGVSRKRHMKRMSPLKVMGILPCYFSNLTNVKTEKIVQVYFNGLWEHGANGSVQTRVLTDIYAVTFKVHGLSDMKVDKSIGDTWAAFILSEFTQNLYVMISFKIIYLHNELNAVTNDGGTTINAKSPMFLVRLFTLIQKSRCMLVPSSMCLCPGRFLCLVPMTMWSMKGMQLRLCRILALKLLISVPRKQSSRNCCTS